MKKQILTLILCSLMLFSYSQDEKGSVEKSTFGIQTGFLGLWAHNELKLSNEFALRSEIGLDTGYFYSSFFDISGFVSVPTFTIEPRWYYNLNKRLNKSKRIDGNSGNFFSLKTTYHPDWFVISNEDLKVISDLSIIPTWGIRRNIGKHFNYEAGFGAGYIHYLDSKTSDFTTNIHLRIGYRF